MEKQDVNRELIVQSNELLEKIEKTQTQSLQDAQKMMFLPAQFQQFEGKGQSSDAQYE